MEFPKPGDIIYVETERYVWHGADDICGGKATVAAAPTNGTYCVEPPFVCIVEQPGASYNWNMLSQKQAELAAEFGDSWAHPDPDLRPEFNTDDGWE
jgi:hypothetical protein